MGEYVKKKKDMVFQSVESLQQVVNVVNEAAAAVNDKSRTIRESAIPEVLAGALGAGIGGVGSFAALYGLGSVVGLSAAGITSGLAAAGSIVGGGMVAGVFVLAAPVAALAAGGVGLAAHLKNKQLRQEKERLYKEALKKHEAIIQALKSEADADKERLDYVVNGLDVIKLTTKFNTIMCGIKCCSFLAPADSKVDFRIINDSACIGFLFTSFTTDCGIAGVKGHPFIFVVPDSICGYYIL